MAVSFVERINVPTEPLPPRRARSMFVVALLCLAGCITLAWVLGLAAFAAAYETLRLIGREELLESSEALHTTKFFAAAVGFLTAAAFFGGWYRSDVSKTAASPKVRWKTLLVSSVATFGAAPVATSLILLAANVFGLGLETIFYIAFGVVVSMLLACVLITAAMTGPATQFQKFGFGLKSAVVATTLLAATIGLNWSLAAYGEVGRSRRIVIEVTFADNSSGEDATSAILKSPTDTSDCSTHGWEFERGRNLYRVSCIFKKLEDERTIVVRFPGRPDIVVKLPIGRNPRSTRQYTNLLRLDGGNAYRYRIDSASVFGG